MVLLKDHFLLYYDYRTKNFDSFKFIVIEVLGY